MNGHVRPKSLKPAKHNGLGQVLCESQHTVHSYMIHRSVGHQG